MFGRKYKSIEKKLDETVEECAEILASFAVRLSEVEKHQERLALRQKAERDARIALANREARHEMRVKERMDEYAVAICELIERMDRAEADSRERAKGQEDVSEIATILDEYLNGAREESVNE